MALKRLIFPFRRFLFLLFFIVLFMAFYFFLDLRLYLFQVFRNGLIFFIRTGLISRLLFLIFLHNSGPFWALGPEFVGLVLEVAIKLFRLSDWFKLTTTRQKYSHASIIQITSHVTILVALEIVLNFIVRERLIMVVLSDLQGSRVRKISDLKNERIGIPFL